jgi:hypothetical protein
MSMNRRSFLEHVLASGALAGLGVGAEPFARGQATAAQDPNAVGSSNAYAFWSNYYAGHLPNSSETQSGAMGLFGGKKGDKDAGVQQDRQVNFLSYDTKSSALRFPQAVENSELLDTPGDVSLSTSVGGIRLSKEDQDTFKNAGAAQLRVDLAQNESMSKYFNISDKLAWASMAALMPSKLGTMPPLQDLSFDPSTTKDVLLPGGTGSIGVNVSLTHRESTFYKLMGGFVTELGRFSPIMGLPAISVTALSDIYKLYGYLEHRAEFLFQTKAPMLAYTTQQARASAKSSFGVNLVTGDYILVPQQHVATIQSHLTDLKLMQNYLVPQDAKSTGSVYDMAQSGDVPDISYVTLNVKLAPAFSNGGPSGTVPAGTMSAPSSSSSSKSAAKSTKKS